MKNIKTTLEKLFIYYNTTRAAGHTTLMKEGIKNYDKPFLVLTHNMRYGKEVGVNQRDVVSLQGLNKLKGSNRPLAIDNAAIHMIIQDSLTEITRLEKDIEKSQVKINTLETKINTLEEQLKAVFSIKIPFIGQIRILKG